ncbi:MAG: hypothetical protein A3A97_02770 [Candidatus Terrybacteria bacterium RIFCSPLOWO2_01_FULL_40_23]|uniref:Ig-like domain-containing protein n=1 Tax=Candidatus Terrybacteria bacterium RIFCSPLOWO2_01_FULL_40_23 TaxID=1802366 RepID=A0A1G2PU95_9BACT|nr:MAG: hypothetical protein A3A97_02770 [Candidatus Terrybacteria bacterium RIFCSPLOWO2_01_FULL_40_23]
MIYFSQRIIIAIAVGILALGATGIGITVFASGFIKTENSFNAYPSTVAVGSGSTLSWSSTRAVSCTASGAWSGKKDPKGTEIVKPTETSVYSIACYNARGMETTSSLTVTTRPKVHIDIFELTPSSDVADGQAVTIRWNAQEAVRCTARGSWSGNKSKSGSEILYPSRSSASISTAPYYLDCYGNSFDLNDKNDIDSRTIQLNFRDPSILFDPEAYLVHSGRVLSVDTENKSFVFQPDGSTSKSTVYYNDNSKYFFCSKMQSYFREIVTGARYKISVKQDIQGLEVKNILVAVDDLSVCISAWGFKEE